RKHKCPIKNITSIPITNPIPVLQIEPDTNKSRGLLLHNNPLDQVSTSQTDEYLFREEFEYLKALDLIEKDTVLNTGINFTQIRVSDPKRPHDNFKLLSNWEAI
ncbi:39083_t:CDS:1, partial [Gigaspora margarita]